MKSDFDRVREFHTLSGGRLALDSGCNAGCRHGGCWRAAVMDLDNGTRCRYLGRGEVVEDNVDVIRNGRMSISKGEGTGARGGEEEGGEEKEKEEEEQEEEQQERTSRNGKKMEDGMTQSKNPKKNII